jgi:biopolymer transport protein ExbD
MLRLSARQTPRIAIHLTALIDIVFLLLIYFLLTSSFVEQEGIAISVPEVRTTGMYPESIPVVLIDEGGQFYLEKKAVSDKELSARLRACLALSAEKSVAIKADKRVAYERVVQALEIAKENGADALNLAVEKKIELRKR